MRVVEPDESTDREIVDDEVVDGRTELELRGRSAVSREGRVRDGETRVARDRELRLEPESADRAVRRNGDSGVVIRLSPLRRFFRERE
jgi:hypothetical protein